jgi:hypothetical protein
MKKVDLVSVNINLRHYTTKKETKIDWQSVLDQAPYFIEKHFRIHKILTLKLNA